MEGRKNVLCVWLIVWCFPPTGQVSLHHGLTSTPQLLRSFLGVKGRWGDVSRDPPALCQDISDREAASMSQPEPGMAEFGSFSDTGFLWDLSFPVTLWGHVWEQEGAGTLLEAAQRLRAPALPRWAVPIAITPLCSCSSACHPVPDGQAQAGAGPGSKWGSPLPRGRQGQQGFMGKDLSATREDILPAFPSS